MWRGREGEATAREGGICGKSQGALFSKSRTQKAPLFPTTWAHQARYVRRRELTGQPGPRRAREGSSYVAVPGASGGGVGNCVRPLVIFRALSMLRGVTHRSSAHVAGEPDGLYSRQRQERDGRGGVCSAPQPSCWPSVFQPWIYLSQVPTGRAQPSWVPWKPQIC